MVAFQEIDGCSIASWINDGGFSESRKNLVFVHGSGGNQALWERQYREFADECNIVGVNLPGHGQSEGTGEREVGRYVEWVKKIVEGYGLKKPVLVGHSLGAAISLTFAIQYGEMLSGIVPVGSGVRMPVNEMILEGVRTDAVSTLALVAKFSVAKENREQFTQAIIDDMLQVKSEIIYGDFLSCENLDITDAVATIRVPTLLICGEDDKMTPPALSQFIKEEIAGAELAVIKGAGHFVMQENAGDFNTALRNFIRRIP